MLIISGITEKRGGSQADLGIPYDYHFNAVVDN